MIKYYFDVNQKSEEWFELRKGKLTASNATAIGANGAGLITYCREIVSELLGEEKEHYTNEDIERGNELEELAITAYEFKTGVKVNECGFVENSKFVNCGISPDGLILDKGGCEVKARNYKKHLALILGDEKEIPFNQIQMSLLITEREWWDFISFNPDHEKELFIKRIYPDLKYFEKLKKGIETGNKLIKQYFNDYKNYQLDF